MNLREHLNMIYAVADKNLDGGINYVTDKISEICAFAINVTNPDMKKAPEILAEERKAAFTAAKKLNAICDKFGIEPICLAKDENDKLFNIFVVDMHQLYKTL